MQVILTICSANYLAHAKVLGNSLARHNPEFHFVIGLADRLPHNIDRSYWHPYELIPVEMLSIDGFDEMVQRYDIVELNTAIKPFFIEHLYGRDPAVTVVIYLDPDIVTYSSLAPLVGKLQTHSLIVTPHSCTYDDTADNIYYETGMLSTGLYNLGFIATARSDITFRFLKWWQRRLREYCYYAPGSGLFVDQIWLTLAPLYFPGVYVEKDPGYNMSYWNIFERRLSVRGGRHMVNDSHDLVFYHFSHFDPERPEALTKRTKSMTKSFSERPDLLPLYADYGARLVAAHYKVIKCYRYSLRQHHAESKRTTAGLLKYVLRRILRSLPSGAQSWLKRLAQLTLNSLK